MFGLDSGPEPVLRGLGILQSYNTQYDKHVLLFTNTGFELMAQYL